MINYLKQKSDERGSQVSQKSSMERLQERTCLVPQDYQPSADNSQPLGGMLVLQSSSSAKQLVMQPSITAGTLRANRIKKRSAIPTSKRVKELNNKNSMPFLPIHVDKRGNVEDIESQFGASPTLRGTLNTSSMLENNATTQLAPKLKIVPLTLSPNTKITSPSGAGNRLAERQNSQGAITYITVAVNTKESGSVGRPQSSLDKPTPVSKKNKMPVLAAGQ